MALLPVTKSLTDKVAIVSASAQGIGFAIAKRLGLDGASIVVTDGNRQQVEHAAATLMLDGIRVSGVAAQVGKEEGRRKLIDFAIEKYGKLDILVSNAAVNPNVGDTLTISNQQWVNLVQLKMNEALELSKVAIPHIESSGRGSIVFVSSTADFAPIKDVGAYSVMKSALTGLNNTLSQRIAGKSIRVNAVAPGLISTDFSKLLYSDVFGHQNWLQQIPIQRYGMTEECAGAVSFLVSDEACYMTGETIGINGGMQAQI
ncbi:unnamed protein product [Auanema sp. JU1783]|nr:unnamed protein product [Auanema sp. JU1783]